MRWFCRVKVISLLLTVVSGLYLLRRSLWFYFNDTTTSEIYTYLHTLSLHDALPICLCTSKYEQGEAIRIPVAHHDGNYYADDDTLAALEDRGQIAFRYRDEDGAVTPQATPNGSLRNLPAIYNEDKTVPGLMPHP